MRHLDEGGISECVSNENNQIRFLLWGWSSHVEKSRNGEERDAHRQMHNGFVSCVKCSSAFSEPGQAPYFIFWNESPVNENWRKTEWRDLWAHYWHSLFDQKWTSWDCDDSSWINGGMKWSRGSDW
jgi:hypothetical protein